MPVPESIPAGSPVWIDLYTSDPDASRAFYGELFGWTSEQAGDEYGGYINFSKDGHLVAGAMANDGESGTPDLWTIYLAVDDAQAVADATPRPGRPGDRRADAGRHPRHDGRARGPVGRRHRRLAAGRHAWLPAAGRGRRPGLVRAAHP